MTNMQEMLGSMGEGEEGIATNVDIVFVIDATRSMRTTIDMVKESALSFQDKLYDFMDEAKRSINNLRIKVVWFRDRKSTRLNSSHPSSSRMPSSA